MSTRAYKHGFRITYEGRRIIQADLKHGPKGAQEYEPVPAIYLESISRLLDFKAEFRAENARSGHQEIVRTNQSFEEFWREHLPKIKTGKHNRSSTKRGYQERLENPWLKDLQRIKFTGMRRHHIVAGIKKMAAGGLAKKTIESYLVPVQKIYTYANRVVGIPVANPVSAAWPMIEELVVASPDAEHWIYTDEEMQTLYKGLKDRWGEKYLCLVALGYFTGGRISELLGLRWKDLHGWKDPATVAAREANVWFGGIRDPKTQLYIPGTKNGKTRLVGLAANIIPFLHAQESYIRRLDRPEGVPGLVQPDSWVFPDLHQSTTQRSMKKLREELGEPFESERYESFSMHELRHNFGSWMIVETHGDAAYVARLMGDKVETVNSTYHHEIAEAQRDPNRSVQAVMGRRTFADSLT